MAAGLLAVYNADKNSNFGLPYHVALLLFGGPVPGIVWLSAWTWLGELYKAERAGVYVYKLEQRIAEIPGLTERLGFQPAGWESFIREGRRNGRLWGKQTMTYLGTAGVFFGVVVGSTIVFWTLWMQLDQAHTLFLADVPWAW